MCVLRAAKGRQGPLTSKRFPEASRAFCEGGKETSVMRAQVGFGTSTKSVNVITDKRFDRTSDLA